MPYIQNIIWLAIAYLVGSFPTGYLIAKRVRGIDIREHGSGNVGATNVFRTVGKKWGSAALLIDMLKGWIATALLATTSGTFPELDMELKQFLFGAAAISGHTWTPWLKLKGGKGVATSAGALFGIFPLATLTALAVWTVCFVIWRYVSFASIIAAILFPILIILFYRTTHAFPSVFAISVVLAGLLIYNHRTNIGRLRKGTEPRVDFGKKNNPPPTSSPS